MDVTVKDVKTYLYKGVVFTNLPPYLYQKSSWRKKKGEIENCELSIMPIFTIIKEVDHSRGRVFVVTKVIFALVFPFLLVILFSKVTYNHYVGIALTAALLFASYMKGYTETYFIVGLDIISLVAGALFMAKKEIEKREKAEKHH